MVSATARASSLWFGVRLLRPRFAILRAAFAFCFSVLRAGQRGFFVLMSTVEFDRRCCMNEVERASARLTSSPFTLDCYGVGHRQSHHAVKGHAADERLIGLCLKKARR